MDVSFPAAWVAGLLSFLSPCVLPLVPAFVGALYGQVASAEQDRVSRFAMILHGIAFVVGFSAIFVGLGALASGVGVLLARHRGVLMKAGGAVIVLFGLHTTGVIKIPFLYYDTRRPYRPRPELRYLSSMLMGFFFGAGWSPCIGATLAAILTLAVDEATVGRGALLLLTYSMGLGIPFLVLAAGVGRGARRLRTTAKTMRVVAVVSGVFLIVLGILVFTDTLSWLSRWAPAADLAGVAPVRLSPRL